MRTAAVILVFAVACAAPARADGGRLDWPLRPRPAVMRTFDAPSPNWQRGHRGVDLAAVPGQPVYAAGPGTVVFAAELAGRPVVSVAHPGGLRTSYEPVDRRVPFGVLVHRGDPLGVLSAGPGHCSPASCLHWGLRHGTTYLDPLALLEPVAPVLLPLG